MRFPSNLSYAVDVKNSSVEILGFVRYNRFTRLWRNEAKMNHSQIIPVLALIGKSKSLV